MGDDCMMDRDALAGPLSDPDIAGSDAPADDRRSANRHVSVLVLAKVISGGVAQMCKVRDISSTGMRIETREALRPDQALSVEFRSGRRVEGVVRWVREPHAGIEFAAELAVEILLGHADRTTIAPRSRLPRFERSAEAVVKRDQLLRPAQLLNISMTGACLGVTDTFRVHDQVVVTIDGLPPRSGEVMWLEDSKIGVRFLQAIDLSSFNAWLVA
jgi:hypothetical protein